MNLTMRHEYAAFECFPSKTGAKVPVFVFCAEKLPNR